MILFYVEKINSDTAILEEDEFHHCIKVLRHKIDDLIHITDGRGYFALSKIESISKRNARLVLIKSWKEESGPGSLILAVAAPKSKARWEFLLEKTVEAGVDLIIPINSMHSERVRLNIERARKIMRSAALQSKRIKHPEISESMDFENLLSGYSKESTGLFMAHYNQDNRHLTEIELEHSRNLILVGPEGDFHSDEILAAEKHGYQMINLTTNRLRTETAAMISTAFLHERMRIFNP